MYLPLRTELLMNRDAGGHSHIIWRSFPYGEHNFQIQRCRVNYGQHHGRRSCSGPRSSCPLGSGTFVDLSLVFSDTAMFSGWGFTFIVYLYILHFASYSSLDVASRAEDGTTLVLLYSCRTIPCYRNQLTTSYTNATRRRNRSLRRAVLRHEYSTVVPIPHHPRTILKP